MKLQRLFDWPIQIQVMAGPLSSVVISLIRAGAAIFTMIQVQQTHAEMEESYEFLTDVNQLSKLLVDMETGMRGYVLAKEPDFLAPYNNAASDLPILMAELRQHAQSNP